MVAGAVMKGVIILALVFTGLAGLIAWMFLG